MCNKQSSLERGTMSPLPIKLAKITVIVIFFCFAECAAGSCLSYGHACWGAHGKRSGDRNNIPEQDIAANFRKDLSNPRWFLSRLVRDPLDLRYVNERELDMPGSQREIEQQLLADIQVEADPLKGVEDLRNTGSLDESDFLENNNMYPQIRNNLNKIKNSRFLNKRSTKMI